MTEQSERIARMRAAPRKSTEAIEIEENRLLEALPPQRRDAVRYILAGAPRTRRLPYVRACAGKGSPRAVIKQNCLECCDWQREEVRHCVVLGCCLWAYRPFQDDPPDSPLPPAA